GQGLGLHGSGLNGLGHRFPSLFRRAAVEREWRLAHLGQRFGENLAVLLALAQDEAATAVSEGSKDVITDDRIPLFLESEGTQQSLDRRRCTHNGGRDGWVAVHQHQYQ